MKEREGESKKEKERERGCVWRNLDDDDDQSKVKTQSERDDVEGAIFFLLNLAKGLQELTTVYSKSPWILKIMKIRIRWANSGVGIRRLFYSRRTKFGKLIVLLTSPLFLVSTTCRFLWTTITSKREK